MMLPTAALEGAGATYVVPAAGVTYVVPGTTTMLPLAFGSIAFEPVPVIPVAYESGFFSFVPAANAGTATVPARNAEATSKTRPFIYGLLRGNPRFEDVSLPLQGLYPQTNQGPREPVFCSTAGFTTWVGLPLTNATIWSKMSVNWSSYSSRVTYPMCGVAITLFIASSGWSALRTGSSS